MTGDPMTTATRPTLSALAKAAHRAEQRDAAARDAALAEVTEAPGNEAAERAHVLWMRETKQTRQDAADLLERILGPGVIDADAASWRVDPTSTTVARLDRQDMSFAVWPLISASTGAGLVLGVMKPGATGSFREISSLAELGAWLKETAPARKRRSK